MGQGTGGGRSLLSLCSEPTHPHPPLPGSCQGVCRRGTGDLCITGPSWTIASSLWLSWPWFSPGPTFCEVTELTKAMTVKFACPTCDPAPHKPPFLQWQAVGLLGNPFAGSVMDGNLGEKGQADNDLLMSSAAPKEVPPPQNDSESPDQRPNWNLVMECQFSCPDSIRHREIIPTPVS